MVCTSFLNQITINCFFLSWCQKSQRALVSKKALQLPFILNAYARLRLSEWGEGRITHPWLFNGLTQQIRKAFKKKYRCQRTGGWPPCPPQCHRQERTGTRRGTLGPAQVVTGAPSPRPSESDPGLASEANTNITSSARAQTQYDHILNTKKTRPRVYTTATSSVRLYFSTGGLWTKS